MRTLIRDFIVCIGLVETLCACGSKDHDEDTSTGTPQPVALEWDKDVLPIVVENCAASGCHGSSDPLSTPYVGAGAEDRFRQARAALQTRLQLNPGDANYMPRGVGDFLAADQETLLTFVQQTVEGE